MRRLNVKLVIWLSATSLIAIVAVYFIHGSQMTRTARVLLDQAKTAEDQDDLETAVSFYAQYNAYRPDDAEEAAHMALMFADIAEKTLADRAASDNEKRKKSSEAYFTLEKTLRDHPERDAVRRRLVDYAMMTGRTGDAADHITSLLKSTPEDAELLTKLGHCQVRLGREREAVETLNDAIKHGPDQIGAYTLLAAITRNQLKQTDEADAIIDKMVEANPDDAKAYVARARYLGAYYKPSPGADIREQTERRKADSAKALELAPEDLEALMLAADIAVTEQDYDEARSILEKAAELYPGEDQVVGLLVQLDVARGEVGKGRERLSASKSTALQAQNFELNMMQGDVEGAKRILAELEKDKSVPRPQIEYMHARMDLANGQWLAASKELERLLPYFRNQELRFYLMIGQCYDALGEPDRQVEVYRKAIAANAQSVPAHIGLGRALAATGNRDEALTELEAVRRSVGNEQFIKSPVARNTMLSLLVELNHDLPEDRRNWEIVDGLLEASEKANPDAKDLLLLKASIAEQKGQHDEARQMLETANQADPKNIDSWLALARLMATQKGDAEGLKVLDQAAAVVGDALPLRLARIAYASRLPAEESKDVFATAAKGIEKFSPDEQGRLRRALGLAYYRGGDIEQSLQMWQKVAESNPNDPQVFFVLYDIATRLGRDDETQKAVDGIKKLFGASSPEAKYVEARRIVTSVRDKKATDAKAALTEARQLVRRATEQRPRWTVLARLESEINILDNRPDEAIANLQRAVELGDADYAVARQLAEWLVQRGRGKEAEVYFRMAVARKPESDTTSEGGDWQFEPRVALTEGDNAKAVALVEEALAKDPEDVTKMLFLARILPRAERSEDAEKLLRQVVERKPELEMGWTELARCLNNMKRESDARDVIAEAQAKLPKDKVELVSAQCFELIGDKESAEEHYRKARDENPGDLGLTRALAMFYGRSEQRDKITKELDRLVKSTATNDSDKEHIAWANRELALATASGGTYADIEKALGRLDDSLMGKVAKAQILAKRPEAKSRLEAIRILEQVKTEVPLQPEGQLILAELYESTGNWLKCKGEMLQLLSKVKDNPRYIAAFIGMLVRNDEVDSTQSWADKLTQLDPDAPLTAAMKARILVKVGKPEEAVAVLRDLLPQPMPREKIRMLVDVARLMEDLNQYEAAESLYREYVALQPNAKLLLANFLGRHGSLRDALDICQSVLETPDETRPVETVVNEALTALGAQQSTATKEDFDRVETWLTRAIARNPKTLQLKLQYVELLDLQRRYAEVEEQYQKLLTSKDITSGQRAIVLNNLAYLLGAQNRTGDSRKLIDEAVQIMGPTSDLLDTRALVHLAHGEARQAVDDLTLSVVDRPTGMKYFHLALAYQAAKDTQSTADAMRKAVINHGLKLADVPVLEQPKFKRLIEETGLNQDSAKAQ
ncbi:MAG: tetratricopeptide repeat protein [Planctomycetia bacterium]|nr:tetratricopeptide repeat protein [Planctomycetia bacterium]